VLKVYIHSLQVLFALLCAQRVHYWPDSCARTLFRVSPPRMPKYHRRKEGDVDFLRCTRRKLIILLAFRWVHCVQYRPDFCFIMLFKVTQLVGEI
jgi:hypothetical protein